MNIRRLKLTFPFVPAVLLVLHLLLIYYQGYFLSPEFSLYPYLTSLGLKPYTQVIDQHLPIIFFGPLSLPKILTSNQTVLLTTFLGITLVTDLLFFYCLKKSKTKNTSLWLYLFIVTHFLFSGNTFWLETIITPLVISLFIIKPKTPPLKFLIGILATVVILIRPTLAPAIFILLFLINRIKLSRFFIAGLLTPSLISLTYLVYHRLVPDFLNLFINFNSTYYSKLAAQTPSLRQLFLVSLILLPAVYSFLVKKKYLYLLVVLAFLLPAWPRFELIHLQPAIAVTFYFWILSNKANYSSKHLIPKILLVILITWSAKKLFTAQYDNFYLTNDVQAVSSYIKKDPESQIFVLGGSDLIYPLSGKTPVGSYYLPSLPWYYQDETFVDRQISALKSHPQSPIIINHQSTVGGLSLQKFAQPVFEYILGKYSVVHTTGPYKIYKIKP